MRPPKRWWGIRHVRALWLSYRLHRWLRELHRATGGRIGWAGPNPADVEYLGAVWRGER